MVLRFLIGNVLTVGHKTIQTNVKASIVSDLQAKQLAMNSKFNGEEVGVLQNNNENFVFNELTRKMFVLFRKMELNRIKRAEKKSTDESVMNEKLALVFESTFIVGSLKVDVWVLMIPVVVIVHGNQEPKSWATITWDNAFAEVNRDPYDVPDKVLWSRLAEVLKRKFHAETGCDLSTDNLIFLCEKVFNQSLPDKKLPDNLWISLSQFYKEPLPGRLFTFWEWFFAAMRLTRTHLRGPWKDGLICGFISKYEAESNLAQCANGTFLLRFSDSELGEFVLLFSFLVEASPKNSFSKTHSVHFKLIIVMTK